MFVRFFGGEAKNIFGDSCLQASHGYVPALQFGACSNVSPVVVNPMLVSTLHCPSLSGRHCCSGRKFVPRISPLSKHARPVVWSGYSGRHRQLFSEIHSAFIASIVARRSIMHWSANKLPSCRVDHVVVQINAGLRIRDQYPCIWLDVTSRMTAFTGPPSWDRSSSLPCDKSIVINVIEWLQTLKHARLSVSQSISR